MLLCNRRLKWRKSKFVKRGSKFESLCITLLNTLRSSLITSVLVSVRAVEKEHSPVTNDMPPTIFPLLWRTTSRCMPCSSRLYRATSPSVINHKKLFGSPSTVNKCSGEYVRHALVSSLSLKKIAGERRSLARLTRHQTSSGSRVRIRLDNGSSGY